MSVCIKLSRFPITPSIVNLKGIHVLVINRHETPVCILIFFGTLGIE